MHLAKLAGLTLTDAEIEKMAGEMGDERAAAVRVQRAPGRVDRQRWRVFDAQRGRVVGLCRVPWRWFPDRPRRLDAARGDPSPSRALAQPDSAADRARTGSLVGRQMAHRPDARGGAFRRRGHRPLPPAAEVGRQTITWLE